MKQIFFRITCDIGLLLILFLLPWWLFLLACIAAVLFINRHYELIGLGFLADAAYAGGTGGAGTHFFFFATTTALVLLSIILKPRLMFYSNR